MIAVKEKHFKSVKTGASLYNGQPTDIGSMCHSAELTYSTPSIQEEKDGVSVENVHTSNKQWFVLRVSYGSIFKAKTLVVSKRIKFIDGA